MCVCVGGARGGEERVVTCFSVLRAAAVGGKRGLRSNNGPEDRFILDYLLGFGTS